MFHERVENLRIKRGISKAELCRQLKIPPTTYSGYSLGTREPDLETVEMFAKYFNVSVDYLVSGTRIGGEFQKKLDKMVDDFVGLNEEDQDTILNLMERMKKK
jgi:transcriptional regulator with XRE-family HTH domain